MKTIKKVVRQVIRLCNNNCYFEAGELARKNKQLYFKLVKDANDKQLEYLLEIMDIFNVSYKMIDEIRKK